MRNAVVLILLFFGFLCSKGASVDSVSTEKLNDIYYNQPFSYFFFGSGIGNMYPIVFESQIATSLEFRVTKTSPLVFVCSPAIMVRMLRQKSVPVRTPNYIPEASIYYRFYDKERKYNYSTFVRYCHNSNGMEADFIDKNGMYNFKDGNFSTNAFDFGLLVSRQTNKYLAFLSGSVSHIFQNEPEIAGLYGTNFIKGHFALFIYNDKGIFNSLFKNHLIREKKSVIAFDLKSQYAFSGIDNIDFFDLRKRLTFQLDISYRPKFWDSTSFFARGYSGRDYYNVQFVNFRNTIMFGIKADLVGR